LPVRPKIGFALWRKSPSPAAYVTVADDVGAGGAQSRSDSAILDRDPIESRQANGRSQPGNVVRILEGHRDAVQRTKGVATSEGGVGGFRLFSGSTLVE
jgi:hypothetical protein